MSDERIMVWKSSAVGSTEDAIATLGSFDPFCRAILARVCDGLGVSPAVLDAPQPDVGGSWARAEILRRRSETEAARRVLHERLRTLSMWTNPVSDASGHVDKRCK